MSTEQSYRAPELVEKGIWKLVVDDYLVDKRLEKFSPLEGSCFFFKGKFIRNEEPGVTLRIKLVPYANGSIAQVKFEYVPFKADIPARDFEKQDFRYLINVNSLEIEAEGTNKEVSNFWNQVVFPRIKRAKFEFRGNKKYSECNNILLGVARYVEIVGCEYKNPIDLIKLCSSSSPVSSWVETHTDGVSKGIMQVKNVEVIAKYGFK
ncbi:MAG: hypothetical protein AABX11_07435 [Nanoarchaeota archaeon]